MAQESHVLTNVYKIGYNDTKSIGLKKEIPMKFISICSVVLFALTLSACGVTTRNTENVPMALPVGTVCDEDIQRRKYVGEYHDGSRDQVIVIKERNETTRCRRRFQTVKERE